MILFTSKLQSIERDLNLPKPARDRILLEIAADMEDLYGYFLEQGLDEEEARIRTDLKFEFSRQSIAELIAVHQSGFQGFMDRLSVQTQSKWERAVLVTLLLMMAGMGGQALIDPEFLGKAGLFIWPVLGIGVTAGILATGKFYTLFIKKDRHLRQVRKGLPLLLLLGVSSLFTGLYGFSVELYLALRKLAFNPEGVWLYVIEWLWKGSPILLLSLTITLVTAIIWFALIHKVQSIEQTEVALLLAE